MPRRKVNPIHKMFVYDQEKNVSTCLSCQKNIKGCHSTNLNHHFSAHHPKKFQEILEIHPRKISENSPNTEGVRSKVLQNCLDLVVKHGHPFELIEDTAFRNILKLISKSPNVQQVVKIDDVKSAIREKANDIRKSITEENQLLALKIDVVSINLKQYIGFNLQYVSNGNFIIKNLGVEELQDLTDENVLKGLIAVCLGRYGIKLSQIVTITVDYGAPNFNIDRACNESLNISTNNTVTGLDSDFLLQRINHDVQLSVETNQDSLNHSVTSTRCPTHCLQIAVRDACENVQGFFDKCRDIVRKLSTADMVILLREQELPQAVIDVPPWWNTTIDMLQSLLGLKPFCDSNLDGIENDFWITLKTCLQILQPCNLFYKKLLQENFTIGDFYINWMRCRFLVSRNNEDFSRNLESCLESQLDTLFENDHFLAAIYLDPRINSVLTNEQQIKARSVLLNIYRKLTELNSDQIQNASTSGINSTNDSAGEVTNFEDYLRRHFTSNKTKLSIKNEYLTEIDINTKLKAFLEEPSIPSETNIMEFWKTRKMSDSNLYKLAEIVFATPATSVSVQKLYSYFKFITNNLSLRFSDTIVEDIILIRDSLNH